MPNIGPSSLKAAIADKASHTEEPANGETIDPKPAASPRHGMQASTPDPRFREWLVASQEKRDPPAEPPAIDALDAGPVPSPDLASDERSSMLSKIRTAVDNGAKAVCTLFCAAPVTDTTVRHLQARLPESVLVLPHRAALGPELWLAALAMGACRVALLGDACDPTWHQNLRLARAIIAGFGLNADSRLLSLEPPVVDETPACLPALKPFAPAAWAPARESRALLWQAIDHLYDQLDGAPSQALLYLGAPFGKVRLDASKCTLCMACAGACPTAALSNGSDRPQIRFRERDCIQCEQCRQLCPEQAVSLTPRICYDRHLSLTRVLHQDEPLCCSVCGAPFATPSMIAAITRKLSSHWMYQNPSAVDRLAMCRDCRIRSLYDSRQRPPVGGGLGKKT